MTKKIREVELHEIKNPKMNEMKKLKIFIEYVSVFIIHFKNKKLQIMKLQQ